MSVRRFRDPDDVLKMLGTDANGVPVQVSNFQGRAMLRMYGIFDVAQAYINAIPDATQCAVAQEAFNRADFHRDSPLVAEVAGSMSPPLTDDQIDSMFKTAAGIKV